MSKKVIFGPTMKCSWLIVALLALFLVPSCSDDDGGSGVGSPGTATVMILIHDAPVDSLKEVWLTIGSLELIGGDDTTGPMILTDSLRMDLLALDSVSRLLTLAEVEPGSYAKLRLTISDPEFVTDGGVIIEASDIQLVANGKVDINFQGGLEFEADSTTVIILDLDLDSSIQINLTGSGKYILRPQIHVGSGGGGGGDGDEEIEIEEATILSIDVSAGSMQVESPGSASPLTILIAVDTEIKDHDGTLIGLDDLSVGMVVEIEGDLDSDTGVITATKIKVQS